MKTILLSDDKSFCLFSNYDNLSTPKPVCTLEEWYDYIINNNIKNMRNNEEDIINNVLFNLATNIQVKEIIDLMNEDEYNKVIQKINDIGVQNTLISYRNLEGEESIIRDKAIGCQIDTEDSTLIVFFEDKQPLSLSLSRIEYIGICKLEFIDLRETFKEKKENENNL